MSEAELKYVNSLSREQLINMLKQAISEYENIPSEVNFLMIAQRGTMMCAKPILEREGVASILRQTEMASKGRALLDVDKLLS